MKKVIYVILAALAVTAVSSCNDKKAANGAEKTTAMDDSIMANMAKVTGQQMQASFESKDAPFKLDKKKFVEGIKAIANCDTTAAGKSYLSGIQFAMMQLMNSREMFKAQYGVNFDVSKFADLLEQELNAKKMTDADLKLIQQKIQTMLDKAAKKAGKPTMAEQQAAAQEQMKAQKGADKAVAPKAEEKSESSKDAKK